MSLKKFSGKVWEDEKEQGKETEKEQSVWGTESDGLEAR